jgi:hypothetical protein
MNPIHTEKIGTGPYLLHPRTQEAGSNSRRQNSQDGGCRALAGADRVSPAQTPFAEADGNRTRPPSLPGALVLKEGGA